MIKSCGYPIVIIRFSDGKCRINVVMYLKQIRKGRIQMQCFFSVVLGYLCLHKGEKNYKLYSGREMAR